MKNLRISLTAIVFAIILTISTGVFAYTGIGNVTIGAMPGTLTNGQATVSQGAKFQFVEVTAEKYNKIKNLEDQYDLLVAYEKYSADETNATLESAYSSACDEYFAKYGKDGKTRNEVITEVLNSYRMGSTLSEECKSVWINELVDFNEANWTDITDGKITVDLSTFTGTKYYIAWVETTAGKYNAEAYKATGTKTEEPKEEPKNEPATKNETPVKNNKPVQNIKKSTSTAKNLPKAGKSDIVLVLMTIVGSVALISYRKYSKIK